MEKESGVRERGREVEERERKRRYRGRLKGELERREGGAG